MTRRHLGWRKDLPDIRDTAFTSLRLSKEVKQLPVKVDLRTPLASPDECTFPEVYDQGELGSCTAQAVGAICDYKYGTKISFIPSALFLYYITRSIEGTVQADAGASIRATIKAVNKFGICDQKRWPYRVSVFATKPPRKAYAEAEKHQALSYRSVRQKLDDLRAAIADRHPIAFGFGVYESFYKLQKKDPVIKYPNSNESLLGGHAVVIVGYDDDKRQFIIRNSWSASWGDEGYFYMPYEFALDKNLCSDFWTIELME